MKKRFPLVMLLLAALVVAGCGKAGKILNKADDAEVSKFSDGIGTSGSTKSAADSGSDWLRTHLSLSIPNTVIRALREREKEEFDFELHPFVAIFSGSVMTESGELPATVMISLRLKCAWLMSFQIRFFLEQADDLLRVDTNLRIAESVDASEAFFQSVTEWTLMPSSDADDGKIIDRNAEKYSVTKLDEGFKITFKFPEEEIMASQESAMLLIESEKHMLDMLRKGIYSYSQNVIDNSVDMLYTRDKYTTVPYIKNPTGVKLWEQNLVSYEYIDNEWKEKVIGREIMNSQGVPLYYSDQDMSLSLQEVMFPRVEGCDAETKFIGE